MISTTISTKFKSSKDIERGLASDNGGNRQMPTGDILRLKKVDYQVYAWLQANCLWGSTFANSQKEQHDDWSYIYKDSCSSRYVVQFLKGCSFNTVARSLKSLEDLGLIISSYDNKNKEVYILPKPESIKTNNGNYYILIPAPLLRFLSNFTNKDTIKFYCAVRAYTDNECRKTGKYGWWYENLQAMAYAIGLGTGKQTEQKIVDIINGLEELDLITVQRRELKDSSGKLICKNKYFIQAKYQSHYRILDKDKTIYQSQRKLK